MKMEILSKYLNSFFSYEIENVQRKKIRIFYFSIHIAHTLCNIPFEMIYLK